MLNKIFASQCPKSKIPFPPYIEHPQRNHGLVEVHIWSHDVSSQYPQGQIVISYFGAQVAVFNSPKRTKASSRTFRSTCAALNDGWWSEEILKRKKVPLKSIESTEKYGIQWNTWFFSTPIINVLSTTQIRFQATKCECCRSLVSRATALVNQTWLGNPRG